MVKEATEFNNKKFINFLGMSTCISRLLIVLLALTMVIVCVFYSSTFSDLINAHYLANAVIEDQIQSFSLLTIFLIFLLFFYQCLASFGNLLSALKKEDPLSLESVKHMRSCAFWFFILILYSIFVQMPSSYIATMHNAPGESMIAISIGLFHLMGLLSSAIFWLMAHLQLMALAIQKENDEIV